MRQGKRNIVLGISLVAMVTACVIIYGVQQNDDRVIVDAGMFRVADLPKIDGVVLESSRGKVSLHYDGGWKVNDKFAADRQLITVLFATLEQAVPKRPVLRGQLDSVKSLIDSAGISVGLFEGTVLKRHFQTGGDERRKEAFFRLDKDSDPFLVTIPGYRVYVSRIFELDENGWRDKRIFDFSWRDFKELTSSFPGEAFAGFTIGMPINYFTVTDLNHADTAKVMTYLDDLSLLRAEQIISPGASKRYDSLARTAPLNIIQATDVAGRLYSLKIFAPLSGDPLVLGMVNDRDMMLLDREKVGRIYRKKGYFK